MYNFNIMKNKSALFIISTAFLFSPLLASAQTWVGPTATAPNSNAATPINTSSTAQTKSGALTVTGALTANGGAAVASFVNNGGSYFVGNVGIGTASPGSLLDVYDGTNHTKIDGNDLMFTRTSANYIWGDSAGGYIAFGSNGRVHSAANANFYLGGSDQSTIFNGNVAILKAGPAYPLDVSGNVNASGYCIAGANCITSWPSGGTSQWTTSGSNIYYTAGNVGVGTTNPGALLDLGAATGIKQLVYGTTGTSGYQTGFGVNLGQAANSLSLFYGGASNANFEIVSPNQTTWPYTSYTTRLAINASGNVGIGTTAPGAKLEVSGPTDDTNGILRVTSTSGGAGLHINSASGSGLIRLQTAGTSKWGWLGEYPTAGKTCFYDYGGGSGCELTLVAGGNVGIGMTSPLMKLDITGSSGLPATSGTTPTGSLRLHASNNAVLDMGVDYNSANSWLQATDQLSLALSYGLLLNPRGGNVGIGTTAPGYKLSVVSTGNGSDIGIDQGSNQYGGIDLNSSSVRKGFVQTDITNSVMDIGGDSGIATAFFSSGTEKMRITSAGNVGIGTTAPGYKLQVGASGDGTSIGANAYYYISDARMKKDIETLDPQTSLDNIMKLRGVSFDWKSTGAPSIGVIAQEVEKVYPELVNTDSTTGIKSVEYGNLVAPLISAIQAQQKEIADLKAEVDALKAAK